MNKKEQLKTYLRGYGELDALRDISCILQELSAEWKESSISQSTKVAVTYALSDAAFKVNDAARVLEIADELLVGKKENAAASITEKREALQEEYNTHYKFFQSLSATEFAKLYKKDAKAFASRVKRLEWLRDQLQKSKQK